MLIMASTVKFLYRMIKNTLLGSGLPELEEHQTHEIFEQFAFVDGNQGN